MLLLLATLARSALAYETDPLTARDVPLDDVAAALEAWTTRQLVAAAAATNADTRCRAGDQRTRRVLAGHLHDKLAAKVWLDEQKGPVRGLGYDRITAFLEEHPDLDRVSFPERSDLYSEATLTEAPVLASVGPCSTVRIGDVRVGTDKVSHFVDLGHAYFEKSRGGRNPGRAVRWGTRTERTFYGLLTSSAFSYADLAANWDGYLFYVLLLTEDSPLQRDAEGCVQVVAPLGWADRVDWTWDELYNPNVFTPGAQAAIDRYLDAHADELCSDWEAWGPDALDRQEQAFTMDPPWLGDRAPPREDPYGLVERCGRE